jgi:hypothetical protein
VSGIELNVLRGYRACKTLAACLFFFTQATLLTEEFDLLVFPHRIKRLRRIVTALVLQFFRHAVGGQLNNSA